MILLVGTYAPAGKPSVFAYAIDGQSATLLASDASIESPSWITVSGSDIYAVSECAPGKSYIARMNLAASGLAVVDTAVTSGWGPCHIALSPTRLYAANYGDGSLAEFSLYPLKETAIVSTGGKGTVPRRQDSSHYHFSALSPDGKFMIVTDLGCNRIFMYAVEGDSIASSPAVTVRTPDGSGPRHFIFNRAGDKMYLINELSGNLTTYSYDGSTLTEIHSIKANPTDEMGSAAIVISPDNRFIYTSHRLASDGIALFSIDETTGLPVRQDYFPTGRHPRSMLLSPDGSMMFVACRDENCIEAYPVDRSTGRLQPKAFNIDVVRPVGLALIKCD